MTEVFRQRGGARVGGTFWRSVNATWPFAVIEVADDAITLSALWRKYRFPRDGIRRLSVYSGWFSTGVRIEHQIEGCPPFMVFWTFDLPALEAALAARQYELAREEDTS